MARKLNDQGIATLRFDPRGVIGNVLTCPAGAVKRNAKLFVTACINNSIRATVAARSQGEDFELVYNFAAALPDVDAKKIMFIAHSEASVHVARLVELREGSSSGRSVSAHPASPNYAVLPLTHSANRLKFPSQFARLA